MSTEEIIEVIKDLPVTERIKIVDKIIESYNPSDPEVEQAWIEEAQRRTKQLESGKIDPVSAEDFENHAAQLKKQVAE
jgi:putative addiction module component (TIGR02574 family)